MADTDDTPSEYVNPKYRHVLAAVDEATEAAVRRGAHMCAACGSLGVVILQNEGAVYNSSCPACT